MQNRIVVRWSVASILILVVGALPAAADPPDVFDHLRTGFPLTGSHERVRCESCHVRGMFAGTPRDCATCHSGGGFWQATRKPIDHFPTVEDCDACHITTSWSVARFDHWNTSESCFRCHNGQAATGKNRDHVPSSNDCQVCHQTFAWVPAGFDHSMITGSCFSCHNGTTAPGKPNDHIPSSNSCEACHDTRSWNTGHRFDHSGVTGNCINCHNGSTATGKGGGHIPSSNACETCHSTLAWRPAGFDHSGVSGSCGACHNGSTATGKPNGHFITTLECDSCHRTTAWLPFRYSHSSASYPGDHAGNLDCRACHTGGSQSVPWRNPAYQPDCAGCHAADFKPGPHKKIESNGQLYSVGELRDCSGSCHFYTDPSLTTIKKSRSGEHRASKGDW